MASDADAWVFKIHLIDGQTVLADVREADFERIRDNNPRYSVPADVDPLEGAGILIYSMLLQSVDTRIGATGVRDREGRKLDHSGDIHRFLLVSPPKDRDHRELGFVRPAPRS